MLKISRVGIIFISFIWVIAFTCDYVFAQPTVTDVSETLSEESSALISGSDFGAKITATPIEFLKSNINNGTDGEPFSAPGWDMEGAINPRYSNSKQHSGNISLLFDFNDDTTSRFMAVLFDSGSGQNQFYFTAWINLTKNDDRTRFQWKSWRLDNNGTYDVSDGPSIIHDMWWYDGTWGNSGGLQCFYDGLTSGANESTPADAFVLGEWIRVEGYYRMASGGGVADGLHWLKRIGRPGNIFYSNNMKTHGVTETNDNDKWRYLRLGLGYTNLLPDESDYDMKIYYDDIYIDNTQARVEIGDNSVWDNCTHREIQIPTAWSEDSITLTVNQGTFSDGDTAYLFVVDANGNVSNGKQIIFGSGGGGGSFSGVGDTLEVVKDK